MVALIRRYNLHVSHGVGWTFSFFLLGYASRFFEEIASDIGISYPPVLAIALAFGAQVVIILCSVGIERT